ncbi:MAG: cell wall/surface repeat protein [Myxococcaceae bacterium]|nr:cell wall/surface repeat protein [Myxococcaceae bacterium]
MQQLRAILAATCTGLMVACGPEAPFCQTELVCTDAACSDAGASASEECISFEKAAALADDPQGGVRRVSARAEPTQGGFVATTSSNDQAVCRDGACYVKRNGAVSLHAVPETQNLFERWSGCSDSTEPNLTLSSVHSDRECVAHFAPYLIIVLGQSSGWYRAPAVALRAGAGTECTAVCRVSYGGTMTLTAPQSESYRFLGWSGCSTSAAPELILENLTRSPDPCVARYEPVTARVSWSVAEAAPGGSVRIVASGPDDTCDATHCAVVLHQSLSIEAVPDPGFRFAGWSGCSSATETILTLPEISSELHCEARFTASL